MPLCECGCGSAVTSPDSRGRPRRFVRGHNVRVHGSPTKRGGAHHRWTEERIVSEHGYIKIRVGKDHPLADPNGYAYEHLVVWCAAGRPRPQKGFLLHHRNEDPSDNRLENLRLMRRGHHNAHHNAQRGRDDRGRFRPKDGRTWDEMPAAVQALEEAS